MSSPSALVQLRIILYLFGHVGAGRCCSAAAPLLLRCNRRLAAAPRYQFRIFSHERNHFSFVAVLRSVFVYGREELRPQSPPLLPFPCVPVSSLGLGHSGPFAGLAGGPAPCAFASTAAPGPTSIAPSAAAASELALPICQSSAAPAAPAAA